MNKVRFDQLQETLYVDELENGLSVYVLPKKGFNKTFATFTTKYGSIDNHFTPLDEQESLRVPDGIAHFLEHKLFDDEDGDVFQNFSKLGASANAFTSFTRTAYLFSSTMNVEKNLDILINFVQNPYFTDESVDKEKGIIEQEINMYEDNPDWQNFFGLLKGMFKNHPVAIDIAGTVKSINKTTKDLLYTCYNTFYHPNNMVLFIVGNVDPETILKQVRNNQDGKTFPEPQDIERYIEADDEEVNEKEVIIPMPVNTGKCLVGIKERNPNKQGKELLKHELSVQLLLEMMFGQSSENYQTLYEEGLIDDSFSFDYTAENGFGFSVIGGDTSEPENLARRIEELISDFKEKSLDDNGIDRIRKKKIGYFLKAMNSPEFIANQFTRYQFNEMDLFEVIPTLESLKKEELTETLNDHFKLDTQMSKCMITKKEDESD